MNEERTIIFFLIHQTHTKGNKIILKKIIFITQQPYYFHNLTKIVKKLDTSIIIRNI